MLDLNIPPNHGIDVARADALVDEIRTYLDPCSFSPFPYQPTAVQMEALRIALANQVFPITREGVLAWEYYNKRLSKPERPEIVNAINDQAYNSTPAVEERRFQDAQSSGALTREQLDTQRAAFMDYYRWKWAIPAIEQGRKGCWLTNKGWTQDQGVSFYKNVVAIKYGEVSPFIWSPGTAPEPVHPDALPEVRATPLGPDATEAVLAGDIERAVTDQAAYLATQPVRSQDGRFFFADGSIRDASGVLVGTYNPSEGYATMALMRAQQPESLAGTGVYLWSDGTYRFADGTIANGFGPAGPVIEYNALPYPSDETVADSGDPLPQVPVPTASGAALLSGSSAPGGAPQVANSPGPVVTTVPAPAPAGGMAAGLSSEVAGVPTWAILAAGGAFLILAMGRR